LVAYAANNFIVGRHTSLILRPFPREKDLVCSNCACANFSQLFRKQYFSVYFPHINKGITSCIWVGVYWSVSGSVDLVCFLVL